MPDIHLAQPSRDPRLAQLGTELPLQPATLEMRLVHAPKPIGHDDMILEWALSGA